MGSAMMHLTIAWRGAKIALQDGLYGVDEDAQFAADHEVVICHDVDIDRFTTGAGRVDSFTLVQLQQYDLSEKFGDDEYHEVYMATFEDFVREVTPETLLMVELKITSTKDTGIERRVNEILEKYDVYEQVYISSCNSFVIRRLEQINPEIQSVLIYHNSGWDPERAAQTKPEDRVALPWFLQKEYNRRGIRMH